LDGTGKGMLRKKKDKVRKGRVGRERGMEKIKQSVVECSVYFRPCNAYNYTKLYTCAKPL